MHFRGGLINLKQINIFASAFQWRPKHRVGGLQNWKNKHILKLHFQRLFVKVDSIKINSPPPQKKMFFYSFATHQKNYYFFDKFPSKNYIFWFCPMSAFITLVSHLDCPKHSFTMFTYHKRNQVPSCNISCMYTHLKSSPVRISAEQNPKEWNVGQW